ncbi:TonB-dependent receptor [Arenicella xantha]|uniref:Iron complex outermembrane receptor protein n=1 Tax=Arenicella xantha TaxID=644221 RepID=A0A395JPJ9_9GAMM|nr:TonB-dependent receptor [Arenicella xantha]RBP53571.1 iron complex outermembrane receptor protein [Arenicella xantha]
MNTRTRHRAKASHGKAHKQFLPLSLVAIAIASGSAVAQESAIEEIVVTAQHREQNIQDVPISISAFSSNDIESNMFRDVTDFVGRTPNASFVSNGARSRKEISMRGVTNFVSSNQARRTSTFGFYIDGFNLSSSGSNPPIMDIERIEILRGPQSTYFGANALGGGISVTSKAPTADEFGGSVMVDYGSFNTLDVEGTLNIPIISDQLAARINYKDVSSDGNIENINPLGGGNDSDYQYLKGSVLWTPNDKLSVALNFADSDELVGMREGVPSGVFSTFAGGTLFANFPDLNGDGLADPDPDGVGFFPENDDKVNFNSPQEIGTEYQYYIAKVDYDFDSMLFSSITGYVESDYFLRGDIDGGSGDYFNEFRTVPRDSFTQEFRLQSTGDSNLSWNVGAFYNDDEGYIDSKTIVGAAMPFGLPDGFIIDSEESRETSTGWALFGQVDYSFTDKLLVSFGGRYSEETIKSDIAGFGGAYTQELSTEESFTDFSPRFAVSYDVSDSATMYGSVAKGFKSGGVQLSPLPSGESYDPEELWNYEVGYKAEMFDRALRLNVAAFYMDWTDLQTTFQQAGLDENGDFIIFGGIDNAESAESKGLELSITAAPMDGLVANINIGLLDAKYNQFVAFIDGENRVLDGRTIPNSPKMTFSADAEYNFPLTGSYEAFVRGEYQYRDEIESSTSALIQTGFPWQVPSYDVANLRFGVRNDNLSVSFYVENLFDETYFTNAYQKAFSGGLYIEPGVQRIGMKVRYNF